MGKTQPETIKIARPFDRLLEDEGWYLRNFQPNQFTDTVPDRLAIHIEGRYEPRWIEYKVRYGNIIKCTDAQKKVFPRMIDGGVKIWCIAAYDLRGESNYLLRKRLYNKLFEKPNGEIMLMHSSMHKLLF